MTPKWTDARNCASARAWMLHQREFTPRVERVVKGTNNKARGVNKKQGASERDRKCSKNKKLREASYSKCPSKLFVGRERRDRGQHACVKKAGSGREKNGVSLGSPGTSWGEIANTFYGGRKKKFTPQGKGGGGERKNFEITSVSLSKNKNGV